MKIAFVGDSFCANIGVDTPTGKAIYTDWPAIVAEQLNAKIIQGGHGGRHFYTAVSDFLPKISEADIVVCCVTEPYRLFNRHGLSINHTWIEQLRAKAGNHWNFRHTTADELGMPLDKMFEIVDAGELYYKHLFDHEFIEYSNITSVSFLDQLLKEYNKKVIWFPCFIASLQMPSNWPKRLGSRVTKQFDDSWMYYMPVSGPSANIPLHELSLTELKGLSSDKIEYTIKNDIRRNHFNEENNRKMAEVVLTIIKNNKFSPDIIKMEEHFSHVDLNKITVVRE